MLMLLFKATIVIAISYIAWLLFTKGLAATLAWIGRFFWSLGLAYEEGKKEFLRGMEG